MQKIVCSIGALSGPFVARFFTPDQFPQLCYGLVAVNLVNSLIGLFLWEDYVPDKGNEDLEDDTLVMQSIASVKEEGNVEKENSAGSQKSAATLLFNRTTLTLLVLSVINTFAFCVSDGLGPLFYKSFFGFQQQDQCDYMMVLQFSSLLWTPIVPFFLKFLGEQTACIVAALGSALVVTNMVTLTGVWWVPYFHAAIMQGLFGTMIGFGYLNILHDHCGALRRRGRHLRHVAAGSESRQRGSNELGG